MSARVSALALVLCGSAHAACPPLRVDLQPIAPGLWQRAADPGAAHGWTEPTLVAVDARQLWVIDPGPHRCAGLALRRELARRWPGRAQQLINSHAHPDNVLANSAWPRGTPIYALPGVAEQMHTRCPTCLKYQTQKLGRAWMAGTRIVLPNQPLHPGQTLRLGGLRWQVQAQSHAHTEVDLSLWQPEQGWWFAGGLVAWDGVPDLSRGSLSGWRAALPALPPRVLGADPAIAAQRWQATRDYLDALHAHVQQADAEGWDLSQVLGWPGPAALQSATPEQRNRHQRNLQKVWRELEEASLGAPLPANPAANSPTNPRADTGSNPLR